MGKRREDNVHGVREISIDPRPIGLTAVYLVETRSDEEAAAVRALFGELESRLQVRPLSKGTLMSYVVQADESDADLLDEIVSSLKSDYAFVVAQDRYDDTSYRIIRDLCRDTGSTLLRMPRCDICGRAVPFPTTVVSLSDDDGSVMLSRSYCAGCTAEASASNGKQFVRSLLTADRRDFRGLERVDLVRRRSRRRDLRFKIKTDELAEAG